MNVNHPLFKMMKTYTDELKARGIDYETADVDTLADGYCQAMDDGDEESKNLYISALVLRFWSEIGKLQRRSPGLGLEFDDFVDWLVEAIDYACRYRAWQNPDKHVNAQQAIRQCINTIRLQKYYRANHSDSPNIGTFSTEWTYEDGRSFDVADDSAPARSGVVDSTIYSLLRDKKVVEAIIVDTVAYGDSFSEAKSQFGVYSTWSFNSKRCIKALKDLPDDFVYSFSRRFDTDAKIVLSAYNRLKEAKGRDIGKMIRKTLDGLRKELA